MKIENGVRAAKKKKRFTNVDVMDYLVITCIVSVEIFVVVVMFFYYKDGTPPPLEVMQYFFSFFGGELLAMTMITITKKITKARKLKLPKELLDDLLDKEEEEE